MVTHPLNQSRATVEEYFEFCRNSPDARYEYIDGQIIMQAGGKLDHARIAASINGMLQYLLRDGCQALTSDAIVKVSSARYLLPDATITCDERDNGNNDYVQYPCVVFEVLSPSTEVVDRGKKLNYYRECPTIKEYVLVNTREPLVELYRREKHPLWTYRTFGLDDELILASVNLSLPLRTIYKNVTFDE
jgi:Uma2 family endonuclease